MLSGTGWDFWGVLGRARMIFRDYFIIFWDYLMTFWDYLIIFWDYLMIFWDSRAAIWFEAVHLNARGSEVSCRVGLDLLGSTSQ